MHPSMTFKQKHASSLSLFWQILKKTWWLWVLLTLCCIFAFTDINCTALNDFKKCRWIIMVISTLILWIFWIICTKLTDYFSLLKKENAITWSQIFILIFIGLWIICFIVVFNLSGNGGNDNLSNVFVGIAGAVLAWIFQDKVKGAVTFIHLRLHHLLCIDDWIQVPSYNVDGTVKRITLNTITLYNWDTTTSTIPTSALHSDHFINLQKMTEGKTYGRQMLKSFILDTDHFHRISAEEAAILKQQEEITHYLPENDICEGALNAHLFRLYLYQWMMDNPHVSQLPRLIVRWLEQNEDGMPLQIYAFIVEGELSAFEWQQSQIIEHVIESMDWFGLRLFQALSSNDIIKRKESEL